MFKNIEDGGDETIEGYYFEDEGGDKFQATLGDCNIISLGVNGHLAMDICKEDIPRLIKVLEAVYSHK